MLRPLSPVLALTCVGLVLNACSTADGEPSAADPSLSPSVSSGSPSGSRSAAASPSPSASSPTGQTRTRALPVFEAEVGPITATLAQRMRSSHRSGCPVPLDHLRHLRLSHVSFDGAARTGELVVNRDAAQDVVTVFRRLYAARWPIARMRLVDAYGGDDDRSMAADNTSAYNCRPVAGTDRWSEHAYGRAIDLNPLENPYVQAGSVSPPQGRRYADLDRSAGVDVPRGVIRDADVVVRAFAEVGWTWGGTWTGAKDYQHFSRNGR